MVYVFACADAFRLQLSSFADVASNLQARTRKTYNILVKPNIVRFFILFVNECSLLSTESDLNKNLIKSTYWLFLQLRITSHGAQLSGR